ncbi:hypothetical protein KSP40_PGU013787 [Platanthera guangdongensis]|uniref:Uncharacterized protein n=1 Tax=Platanthera guangdongensis TaxID=2320717 RepID=A0ABR2MQ11_9ASPA
MIVHKVLDDLGFTCEIFLILDAKLNVMSLTSILLWTLLFTLDIIVVSQSGALIDRAASSK